MAKLRMEITKDEQVRYISHLDFASAMERAIRRANLPIAYSEGFNPHMKMAFASALAVGVTSDAEYMDLEFLELVPAAEVLERLKTALPRGITVKQANYLEHKTQALMAVVNMATYDVRVPLLPKCTWQSVELAVAGFNAAGEVLYTRESPKGKREINVKQYSKKPIVATQNERWAQLEMTIAITPTGSVKPGEVLAVLVQRFQLPVQLDAACIHRNGLYVVTSAEEWLSPMKL